MISTKKVIKNLERVIIEMDRLNARKAISVSLSRTHRNIPKVTKSLIKDLLNMVKEMDKTNISILDIPNDDSRYIFRDIIEGKLVVNTLDKEVIIGVNI